MIRIQLVILFLLNCLYLVASRPSIEEIGILRERADSLHSIGQTDSAVLMCNRAISLAKESGDMKQVVGTNSAQGVFLRSLGKIDEALKCYNTALGIVTSSEFRSNLDQEAIEEAASVYINLAVLNLDMQQKDAAAANAVTAGDWISKADDPELRSTIYGVAGSVLTGCGDLKRAQSYQDLAYQDALTSGNQEMAFRAAAYTMLIADRLGKSDDAAQWRKKCNELLPRIDSLMARLVYYQAECSICLKHDDRKGALLWFDKILSTDGIDNLPFIKFDCYNNMHIAYAGLGDYKEAYSTLLQSNELRDSLWQEEKAESLRDLTVKYETKEKELALAESEARQARTLNWLFAAVALLLVIGIIFVIYAGRNRRRRMQREIEFASLRADIGRQLTREYIDGLENERQRMARELHDGVCNDLLAIEMNLNNGMSPEKSVALIDGCRESVRRISHELMPPEFAYATIDEVLRYFVAKQSDAMTGKITFSYTSYAPEASAWAGVPDDIALELYRIVQEGVSNAVKHSGATEIEVTMTLENPLLTVKVSDNGKFVTSGKKGVGLSSIRKRADAVNGRVDITSDSEQGTTITVVVKI